MYRKSGFTLAEIVITTAIIGIVSLLGIMSFKPNTQMRSAYYIHVYETLKTAAYNLYLEKHDRFGRNGVNFGGEALCNDLTELINTAESNCGNTVDSDETNFNGDNKIPAFVTTNGISFWMTGDLNTGDMNNDINKDSYGNLLGQNNDGSGLHYVIVFADIEPKKNNKTLLQTGGDGNVVPFIITQYGDVYPIGAPMSNPDIIKAGVKITYKERDANGFVSSKYRIIESSNFENARQEAWGDTVWINNPLSYGSFGVYGNSDNRTLPGNKTNCRALGEAAGTTGKCVPDLVDSDNRAVCCQSCTYKCNVVILNRKMHL